jgi:thioredoxin 1
MGDLLYVGKEDFEREVLQSNQPVLVDFYADWCGPCRALEPVIEELAQELQGRLKVAKLDVDQNDELSLRYNVHSIPTLILFKNGQEVERIIGYMPKAQLLQALEKHLS